MWRHSEATADANGRKDTASTQATTVERIGSRCERHQAVRKNGAEPEGEGEGVLLTVVGPEDQERIFGAGARLAEKLDDAAEPGEIEDGRHPGPVADRGFGREGEIHIIVDEPVQLDWADDGGGSETGGEKVITRAETVGRVTGREGGFEERREPGEEMVF